MNPFCAFMLSVLLCFALPAQGQVAPKDPAPPPAAGKSKAKKPGFFDRLFQGSGGREGSKNQSRSDNDNDDDDDVKGGKVNVPREGEQPAAAVAKTQPKAGKATASTRAKKPSPNADAPATSEAAKSAPASENPAAAKEAGPASVPSQPGAQPSNAGAPPTTGAKEDEGTIQFARPVPGRRGMVYPPGAEEVQANMIDVSDMTPGQLARDPRTGKKFRVP